MDFMAAMIAKKSDGSARYWRVLFDDMTSYAGTFTVEFRETPGGSDLTSPSLASTRAFASSEYTNSHRDDYAFNDSTSNHWRGAESSGVGEWIAWDFNSNVSVNEVSLAFIQGVSGVTIQSSQDNSTWTNEWSWVTPSSPVTALTTSRP